MSIEFTKSESRFGGGKKGCVIYGVLSLHWIFGMNDAARTDDSRCRKGLKDGLSCCQNGDLLRVETHTFRTTYCVQMLADWIGRSPAWDSPVKDEFLPCPDFNHVGLKVGGAFIAQIGCLIGRSAIRADADVDVETSVDTVPVSVPISVPGQTCRNFPVSRFYTVLNGSNYYRIRGQIAGSYQNFPTFPIWPILAYSNNEKVFFK